MPSRTAAIGVLLLLSAPSAPAQQPSQRAGTIAEGVRAVLVDVVVRDKRGQPVYDLTGSDFELFEDGVPQAISAFSTTFDRPARSGTDVTRAQPETAPVRSAPGPGVTAIVFDRLQPESRRIAVQAARSYLGAKEESTDFVAVFGLDLSLSVLVPFTRNAIALRRALDVMLSRPAAVLTATDIAQIATSTAASPPSAGGRPGAPDAGVLSAMQAQMLSDFAALEQEQQGYSTTDGLFAIVSTLGRIPGRKSLVLFSEGIPLSDRVHPHFLGVIDAANRANVSIYAMDAVGLRAESDQARTRDLVNFSAGAGLTSYTADTVSDPYTRQIEGTAARMRSDPEHSLGELASATGGMYFKNTNNLRPAFERVDSDLRNYYLLGYTPTNTKYDGRFRKIDVRVRRAGVAIAARRGYFAVRDVGGAPINEWESGALAALEQRPLGNAFPVHAAAMLFPERGRPGLVPTAVRLKTAPLSFRPSADGTLYTSDFTILARFIDHNGDAARVVRKMSQHYDIRGPVAEIDRARDGEVIFYRESELPPGLYTLEVVVHDTASGTSSVRLSTLEVPTRVDGSLRASSLVLVDRLERSPDANTARSNPFQIGEKTIVPNLGEPVRRASGELGFYFTIYPRADGTPEPPTIELVHQGQVLTRTPMEIGKPDAAGRIQQYGKVPVAGLAAGTYELRATVAQGAERLVRSSLIRIVE